MMADASIRKLLAYLNMRPCFICGSVSWCSHREIDVITAEIRALEDALATKKGPGSDTGNNVDHKISAA